MTGRTVRSQVYHGATAGSYPLRTDMKGKLPRMILPETLMGDLESAKKNKDIVLLGYYRGDPQRHSVGHALAVVGVSRSKTDILDSTLTVINPATGTQETFPLRNLFDRTAPDAVTYFRVDTVSR